MEDLNITKRNPEYKQGLQPEFISNPHNSRIIKRIIICDFDNETQTLNDKMLLLKARSIFITDFLTKKEWDIQAKM